MKKYIDFLEESAKQRGFNNYGEAVFSSSPKALGIRENAANMFAAYAFEEGCKAQRRQQTEWYISDILCDKLIEENINYQESQISLANNPFKPTK